MLLLLPLLMLPTLQGQGLHVVFPVLSEGHVVLPEGHVVLPEGHVVLSEEHVVLSERHVVLPEGHVVLPEGQVVLPEGHVVLSEGHVVLPEGHVVLPENLRTEPNTGGPGQGETGGRRVCQRTAAREGAKGAAGTKQGAESGAGSGSESGLKSGEEKGSEAPRQVNLSKRKGEPMPSGTVRLVPYNQPIRTKTYSIKTNRLKIDPASRRSQLLQIGLARTKYKFHSTHLPQNSPKYNDTRLKHKSSPAFRQNKYIITDPHNASRNLPTSSKHSNNLPTLRFPPKQLREYQPPYSLSTIKHQDLQMEHLHHNQIYTESHQKYFHNPQADISRISTNQRNIKQHQHSNQDITLSRQQHHPTLSRSDIFHIRPPTKENPGTTKLRKKKPVFELETNIKISLDTQGFSLTLFLASQLIVLAMLLFSGIL